jgi:ubiquinone/menaquinone biosynthesis C-methylase UbiE
VARGSDPAVLREAYRTGANYLDRVALFEHQRPRIDFLTWVLDHVELHDGDRVVDIGCGPGLYVRRMRARPERLQVVPLDQSAGMVREAGGRGVVGDAQWLPFDGGVADAVIAAHFLYHVADIPAAVAELHRIVRRGGAVLVTTNGTRHHARVPELIAAAGDVATITKPGHRFHAGNARDFLDAEFASVVVDTVTSRIVLEDPEPMVRFVDSCEEFYAPAVRVEWPTVLERVRTATAAEIAARGTFEMETESAVFVCRTA